MPTSDQIQDFDERYGVGAFERCEIVMRQLRLAQRRFAASRRPEQWHLERFGLPTVLAAGYIDLIYGPPAPAAAVRTRNAQRRAIR
jgi:hypothetical protein